MRMIRISSVEGEDPEARFSRRLTRESSVEMTSLSCLSSSSTKPMAADRGKRTADVRKRRSNSPAPVVQLTETGRRRRARGGGVRAADQE